MASPRSAALIAIHLSGPRVNQIGPSAKIAIIWPKLIMWGA
ncbi:MAG: hypothetical protein JWL62_193, partial [Hyphomicrobiales bacterium]|nr:hypothetical protein [Hyphomicrobiales bacterium]